MRKTVVALLLFVGAAFPYVVGYHIEPVKALWSGWALGDVNHGVAQTITCNFDTAVYCELFAGETLSGGDYAVDVYELPGGTSRVAYNLGKHATKPQSWVNMPLTTVPGKSFTKGKEYEFRFTRSGGDSVQYYFRGGDPYPYGTMLVPGQGPTDRDLAGSSRPTPTTSVCLPQSVGLLPAEPGWQPFGANQA